LSIVTDDRCVCRKAKGQLDIPLAVAFVEQGVTIGEGDGIVILLGNTQGKPDVNAALSRGHAQNPAVAVIDEFIGFNAKAKRGPVDRRPRRFLEMFGFDVAIVAVDHTLRSAYGHASIIRRQVKLFADGIIASIMQLSKARNLAILMGKVQDVLNGLGITFLYPFQEKAFMLGGFYGLDNDTFCTHGEDYAIRRKSCQIGTRGLRVFPTTEAAGFPRDQDYAVA